MSNQHIVRAWKDPEYRSTLSQAQLAALPANPAGAVEVPEESLGKVAAGARNTQYYCTFLCTATCTDCGSLCCPSLECPSRWCTICGPVHPF